MPGVLSTFGSTEPPFPLFRDGDRYYAKSFKVKTKAGEPKVEVDGVLGQLFAVPIG